jgi:hypothetical protein
VRVAAQSFDIAPIKDPGAILDRSGSTVVLVPAGRPMLRTDLYKTVRADINGFFVIGGIAARRLSRIRVVIVCLVSSMSTA